MALKIVGTLLVGDEVGPFTVRRHIGTGFGHRAFEAEDQRTSAPVSIRTLDATSGPDAERRFVRETDVLARLTGPHFPRVLAVGRLADASPYYVVPLYYGEVLGERLVRGRLPIAAVVELGVAVMRALAALHALGFVHGALRKDGIFLQQERNGMTVVLLDLGACKTIAAGSADPRSDLHDAALLLYEALIGQALPPREAFLDAGRPQRLRPDCPPELERLLLRLLSLTPAARPRTATEVQLDLEAVARVCALPRHVAAWSSSPRATSSGPPAPLAWDRSPEPSLRVSDTPVERAFFAEAAAIESAMQRRTLEELPAPSRRSIAMRWVPVVLAVLAPAAGLCAYAFVIRDDGARVEHAAERMRSWVGGSAVGEAPFAYEPLTARIPADPPAPRIRVSDANAQPELEIDDGPAEPVVADARPPPTRPPAARARLRTKRATAATWTAQPRRQASVPVKLRTTDSWDALPEERAPAGRASDNPYATPGEQQGEQDGIDRGF